MRGAAFIGGVLIGVPLLGIGGLFGLNGSNWTWWRWGSYAAAAVTAFLAAYVSRRTRVEFARREIAIMLGGIVTVAACLAVMAQHFNDSYYGNLVWPRLLACVAFAGVLVVGIAVIRSAH